MSRTKLQMIKEYQCPGCVCGSDPETCGSFKLAEDYGFACSSHVLGTMIGGIGSFALGLPRGFCRPGFEQTPGGGFVPNQHRNQLAIRLWTDGAAPKWDNLNVPVWALEKDGALFVRTFSPRVNLTFVDVVDGGKRAELCPATIDVGTFIDEID